METISPPVSGAVGGNFYTRHRHSWQPCSGAGHRALPATCIGAAFTPLWEQVRGLSGSISAPATIPVGSLRGQFLYPPQRLLAALGNSFCTTHRNCWQRGGNGCRAIHRGCWQPGGNRCCTSCRGYWQPVEPVSAPATDAAGSLQKQFLHPPEKLAPACGSNFSARHRTCRRLVLQAMEAASAPPTEAAGSLKKQLLHQPQNLLTACW